MEKYIETKKEALLYLMGKLDGLNFARCSVAGFGFDNDETAQYVKKQVWNEMKQINEILDIDKEGTKILMHIKSLLSENK